MEEDESGGRIEEGEGLSNWILIWMVECGYAACAANWAFDDDD